MGDNYDGGDFEGGDDPTLNDVDINSDDDGDALEDEKVDSNEEASADDADEGEGEKGTGTKCAYRHMRAKKSLKEDPIVIDDLYDEQISKATMGGYIVIDNPELRITVEYMTLYEFQRILGIRVQQLSRGAPARVESKLTTMSPYDTALMELRNGLAPYIILRPMPGYKRPTAEKWYFRELPIPDSYWQRKPPPILKK